MTDYDAALIRMKRQADIEGRATDYGVAITDAVAHMLATKSDPAVESWISLLRDRVHSIKIENGGVR